MSHWAVAHAQKMPPRALLVALLVKTVWRQLRMLPSRKPAAGKQEGCGVVARVEVGTSPVNAILALPREVKTDKKIKGIECQTGGGPPIDPQGVLSGVSNRLTAARLRELLDYDATTGVFTWRKRLSIRAPVGAVAGCRANGLIAIKIEGRAYYGHSLAVLHMTGAWPAGDVLARNGDRTDLRWRNLKVATRSQSAITRTISARNKSGAKGVQWRKNIEKWEVRIGVKGRVLTLGCFDRFTDAVAARKAAECKYFGDFARMTCRKTL